LGQGKLAIFTKFSELLAQEPITSDLALKQRMERSIRTFGMKNSPKVKEWSQAQDNMTPQLPTLSEVDQLKALSLVSRIGLENSLRRES
jgi:hypothetical protein